jgi:hypothetical protein
MRLTFGYLHFNTKLDTFSGTAFYGCDVK